jgi:hypothetical protein
MSGRAERDHYLLEWLGGGLFVSGGEARHQPPWRTKVTKLLNGDDPEFQEISPMITTLRYDLDQKIKRLTDALATVGIASTELEKVRIALEGTAPAALVSTLAHDTCIPIPAQAVIVAKKHEIVRALEAAQNAFDGVRESVESVLGSASLPENEGEARSSGAALIQLPQLLRPKARFSAATRTSTSGHVAGRPGFTALARWLPN